MPADGQRQTDRHAKLQVPTKLTGIKRESLGVNNCKLRPGLIEPPLSTQKQCNFRTFHKNTHKHICTHTNRHHLPQPQHGLFRDHFVCGSAQSNISSAAAVCSKQEDMYY